MDIFKAALQNADVLRSDRLKTDADKVSRDQKKLKNATYMGKAADGTDIVIVDGQTQSNSGFKLISNASKQVGDRVSLRPNSGGGLQRIDAKNNPPETPATEIPTDVAEYYFGISYLYFFNPLTFDLRDQVITLEGDVITDLQFFMNSGATIATTIDYTLVDNIFTFNWISLDTVNEFIICYRRESKKIAFVLVTAGSDGAGISLECQYLLINFAYFTCGVKNKLFFALLTDPELIALGKAKKIKSKINILVESNTVFWSYLNLYFETYANDFVGEHIDIRSAKSYVITFTQISQIGYLIPITAPPTADTLTFTLKNNLNQKGKILSKFKSLEMKTIKSNQALSYEIKILIYDTDTLAPIDGLAVSGYFLYTDLDTDSYEVFYGYGSSGGISISGLSGSVGVSVTRRIEITLSLADNGWVDLATRYGLIDTQRLEIRNTYTVNSGTENVSTYYDFFVSSIFVGTSLNFAFQFKREYGAVWFQV